MIPVCVCKRVMRQDSVVETFLLVKEEPNLSIKLIRASISSTEYSSLILLIRKGKTLDTILGPMPIAPGIFRITTLNAVEKIEKSFFLSSGAFGSIREAGSNNGLRMYG